MKKVSLVFVVTLMLLGIVGKAQNVPNIAGLWTSKSGRSLKIEQQGNKVWWTDTDVSFNYDAKGSYKGDDVFSVISDRRNKKDGCTTYLKFKFTVISDTEMHAVITGMDNKCDISTSYQNTDVYTKQD